MNVAGCTNENGSALPFALIVVLLLSLSCAALLTYWSSTRELVERTIDDMEAFYLAESSINRMAADYQAGRADLYASRGLVDDAGFGVETTIEPFGTMLLGTASVEKRGKKWRFTSLLGSRSAADVPAISLTDSVGGLTLAGTTKIIGGVAIGGRPLRTASLQGRPFTGLTPDKVSQVRHQEDVPVYDLAEQLERASWADEAVFHTGGIIIDADTELPRVLIVDGAVEIRGPISLPRLQTIISRAILRITGIVEGELMLLAGREVEIQDAKLSGDVFGGRRAVVGNSELLFPSSIVVSDVPNGTAVQILGGSRVAGTIVAHEVDAVNPEPIVQIDSTSVVHGRVVTNGATDLQGRVEGTIETGSFQFYISPTIYRNWLNNTEVNSLALPPGFYSGIGFRDGNLFNIAVWQDDLAR